MLKVMQGNYFKMSATKWITMVSKKTTLNNTLNVAFNPLICNLSFLICTCHVFGGGNDSIYKVKSAIEYVYSHGTKFTARVFLLKLYKCYSSIAQKRNSTFTEVNFLRGVL